MGEASGDVPSPLGGPVVDTGRAAARSRRGAAGPVRRDARRLPAEPARRGRRWRPPRASGTGATGAASRSPTRSTPGPTRRRAPSPTSSTPLPSVRRGGASASSRRPRSLPCWVHADLSAENILVHSDGGLAGVIDFGGLGVGDRSVDLLYAWSLLDAPARDLLRTAVRRGRGDVGQGEGVGLRRSGPADHRRLPRTPCPPGPRGSPPWWRRSPSRWASGCADPVDRSLDMRASVSAIIEHLFVRATERR